MRKPGASSHDLTAARRTLASTGWLSEQPPDFRDRILSACRFAAFAPGERLYSLNGPPGGMFGIASGYVSVVANAGRFEPVLIYIGGPGLWAGEAAAVGKTERRVELMARTRVKALQLPAFELERIGSEDAALWRRLHGLTASHFDNALMFAFTLKRGNPRQKIAATLVRLAGSAAEDDDVTVPCSQTELGELAGLSRSTVGPALKALEANGLVRVGYGRITYRPRRLRDET